MQSAFRQVVRCTRRPTFRVARTRQVPVRNYLSFVSRSNKNNNNNNKNDDSNNKNWSKFLFGGIVLGTATFIATASAEEKKKVDYAQIRKEIQAILDEDGYDNGSYGPILVRLAWHASGTYDKVSCTGGSNGATMRFPPECDHGANAGLKVARDRLEEIKKRHPEISYGDLWTLAGVVAVEALGGPVVPWRPGRVDKPAGSQGGPDGRLPDPSLGVAHIKDIFYRMGFNDQELVALIGAHAIGRCHTDRSGYEGPWTQSPTVFTNDFFEQLLERKWTVRQWNGPKQYEDESKTLMMLPTDLALLDDPNFKKWVVIYAEDEERFHRDFAIAYGKLLELGVKF